MTNETEGFEGRQAPTEDEWRDAQESLPVGRLVTGTVCSHRPFGFFVDLGLPVMGLVEVNRVRDEGPSGDLPPVGSVVTAVVLDHTHHNRQIRMSVRPSDLTHAASKDRG